MQSIAELRTICQGPTRATDCLHGLVYGRRISIYLTRIFLRFGITADQATFLFLLLGLVSAGLFAVGGPVFNFLAAVTMFWWYIFDNVDGEIARYRGTTGVTGLYYDYLVHFIVHPAIFFGACWGYFRVYENPLFLLLGFILSIAQLLWRTSDMLVRGSIFTALQQNRCTAVFGQPDGLVDVTSKAPDPPSTVMRRRLGEWKRASLSSRLNVLRKNILNIKGIMIYMNVAALLDLINTWTPFSEIPFLLSLMCALTFVIILDMCLRYPRIIRRKDPDRIFTSLTRRQEGPL